MKTELETIPGYVYAIQISPSYHHAATYVGSTDDIWRRWREHLSGGEYASPLVTAALDGGCSLQILVLPTADEDECRQLEKKFKGWHNGKQVVKSLLTRGAQIYAEAWSMRTGMAFDNFDSHHIDAEISEIVRERSMQIAPTKRVMYEIRYSESVTNWRLLVNGRDIRFSGELDRARPTQEFIPASKSRKIIAATA